MHMYSVYVVAYLHWNLQNKVVGSNKNFDNTKTELDFKTVLWSLILDMCIYSMLVLVHIIALLALH